MNVLLSAYILAVFFILGCDNKSAPSFPVPSGKSEQACTGNCTGSRLIQSCGGEMTSLGDYGSDEKCRAQLQSGHPGCR